eukprot:CAMPEP_0181523748 /NCGR_PEP_ID=MMETSP1110-20121109/68061_1 /TAXON_ID=174948 /ORGANISM="Symbiodinium sp., Strain CCMP421" /LENGTH=482 /DNA_ID=CAMNT_0023654429 /DNA_START=46 /DNA_END=1493 /DNA_ORIENTATION=+
MADAANALAAAKSLLKEGSYEDALAKAEEATAGFQQAGNQKMQSEAMSAKIDIYLKLQRRPEARAAAQEAVALFKAVNDPQAEAKAQLLVSQVCMQTQRYQEAAAAGREALRLARVAGDQSQQADAWRALAVAAEQFDLDKAIPSWQEVAKLTKDSPGEAQAQLGLARAHMGRLSKKLGSCAVADKDDSIEALRAAKEAHAIYRSQNDAARGVLLFNGVHPDVVEASGDPSEIFSAVLSGTYSSSKNALPKPNLKPMKLEEAVPDSKQLDRNKFGWRNPIAGYCYTVVWQPTKDRGVGNNKPRGQYDMLMLRTGHKHHAVSTSVGLRANDASERNEHMMVFMTTQDHGLNYSSCMMNAQHTLGGVVTTNLRKLVFVQFGESFFDWTDTSARTVEMHSVTLGLLRSARIEAPFMTIGFVGGDLASWVQDPQPLIESIFDTVESDECEVIYKNGEGFAPSMVHKPLEDSMQSVKPGKSKAQYLR